MMGDFEYSTKTPEQVLRSTRTALLGFRLLIVVFGMVMVTVFIRSHEHDDSGSQGVFLCNFSMLVLMFVTVLVSRRWARGRDKAMNEVLERHFNFDWYGRYLDALIARKGTPRRVRRSTTLYWVGRAKMAYMRGDFDEVFACLARVDTRNFKSRRHFMLGLAAYILGYYAALYAGNQEMALEYFSALTRYPVKGRKRIQLKDGLLGGLAERAGMLRGTIPASLSQSQVELDDGYTPFARMDQAYVAGVAEYALGNVAYAEEFMNRIIHLGHADQRLYLVRQAELKLQQQ